MTKDYWAGIPQIYQREKKLKKALMLLSVAMLLSLTAVAVFLGASERATPNVVGINLKDAESYYGSRGISLEARDGLGSREIYAKSNWKICRQIQAPGTKINGLFATIDVRVVKTSENCESKQPSRSTANSANSSNNADIESSVPVTVKRTANGNCKYTSSRCANYIVSAYADCSGVSIDMAFYDSSGRRVDDGLEFISNMKKGEQAVVQFNSFEDAAATADILEVKCY